jgi:hypothetical protein
VSHIEEAMQLPSRPTLIKRALIAAPRENSNMRTSYRSLIRRRAAFAVSLAISSILGAPAPAQSDTPPASTGIKITSCSVSSTKNASLTHDCSAEAAKICNGKNECEIQIGYNLSSGKDIDPKAGVLGKMVTILYDCGDAKSRQRGPYSQSDHASLMLECFLM